MKRKPLFLTRNLFNPWLWTERIFLIAIILAFPVFWAPEFAAYVFLPAILCSIGVIVYPKAELGFDDDYLYYMERSILERLTSIEKYPIAQIASIKVGLQAQTRFDWNRYRMEITFTNDTSKTLIIRMRKKVLEFVGREVLALRSEAEARPSRNQDNNPSKDHSH